MTIEQLMSDYGIPGQLEFIAGTGGLIQARITNDFAESLVSTYAGQVLSFKPAGEDSDLLFVSAAAYFQEGAATKGGVPVCWPWFGPDPEGKGRGTHGFVRNRQWQVVGTVALADGRTGITLGLDSSDETLGLWPYAFELRIDITVGQDLVIDLRTLNKNLEPLAITQGLHTYLRVGDVTRAQVVGLEGKTYSDMVADGAEKTQEGPIRIAGEVNRIYTGVDGDLVVEDPALGRRIRIAAQGSRSAVVWNPWIDTAKAMADLMDDDYSIMLCVETTNAGPDQVTIPPGEAYCLGARYRIERG